MDGREQTHTNYSKNTKKKKMMMKNDNNNNNNNNSTKKKFSDEQIRLLESIFKSETKLEPRKKFEVARDVGLEPRQVGIWFQNKRARFKSKQLEQDYTTLRAKYDSLASQFQSLEIERQTLLSQLHNLSKILGDSQDGKHTINKFMEGSSNISNRNNNCGHVKCATDDQELEQEQQQEVAVEGEDLKMDSREYNPENCYYINFEPGAGGRGLYDYSCSINNSKWLDFWS